MILNKLPSLIISCCQLQLERTDRESEDGRQPGQLNLGSLGLSSSHPSPTSHLCPAITACLPQDGTSSYMPRIDSTTFLEKRGPWLGSTLQEPGFWAGSGPQARLCPSLPHVSAGERAVVWPWCLYHMLLEKLKLVKLKRTRQNLGASLRDQGLATLGGRGLGHAISRGHSQMLE